MILGGDILTLLGINLKNPKETIDSNEGPLK